MSPHALDRRSIGKVLESVFEQDHVTVAPVKDARTAEFVGKDLKATIAKIEKRMRAAAAAGGAGPGAGAAAGFQRVFPFRRGWCARAERNA